MPNKNYNSGRNFEYRVKRFFEKQGYWVTRSAGSKSPLDLLLIKNGEIYFVQCKVGKYGMSKKEKEIFVKFCEKYLAVPMLATLKNREMEIEVL